jgi:hypothetical protein
VEAEKESLAGSGLMYVDLAGLGLNHNYDIVTTNGKHTNHK